jgi:ABC-type transporter Mla subunit MlaD
MAESQASDSIGGALDTLDQFIQASTTLRAEVGRLTEELRTTSDERSSLRERLRTMSAALDLEKWARRKAQDELSVLKGSVDLREEQMRTDEEEIGRQQKDLAQQLKKMGETVNELVTNHGRRISRGSSQLVPERVARPRPSASLDIAYGAVLTAPALLPDPLSKRPTKRPRKESPPRSQIVRSFIHPSELPAQLMSRCTAWF